MSQLIREKHQLNWISALYDQHIFVDSEAFRKWDQNLQFEGADTLRKDLVRTRSSEPFFQKQSTRKSLQLIATFYCKSNGINYQQGLLEVIIPFLLFHKRDFELRKCYAYFKAFMKKIFPKILIQRIVEDKKQLPHVLSAITLCDVLLQFHNPLLYYRFKKNQILLSMIVPQWIITLFAKDTKISLVYPIYDYFIKRRNKNIIFYLSISLILRREKQIIEAQKNNDLFRFVNKTLKNIETQQQINDWIMFSEQIQDRTPISFEYLTKRIGFSEQSILTQQDFTSMMKLEEYLVHGLMPIYLSDIQKNPLDFFVLYINTNPIDREGIKLVVGDLQKDIRNRIPQQKILVFVIEDKKQQTLCLLLKFIHKLHQANYNRIGLLHSKIEKYKCNLI